MTRGQYPPQQSVAEASDTVAGYVEYRYWRNFYCNPDQQGAMSAANWAIFADVEMYVDASDPDVNFEHLWSLTGEDGRGDPAANSLFNLTTL